MHCEYHDLTMRDKTAVANPVNGARHSGVLALALLLFCANAALLWHQYDLAQHPAKEVCTTCLGAHALDHGGGATPTVTLVPAPAAFDSFQLPIPRLARSVASYHARAPPVSSLA